MNIGLLEKIKTYFEVSKSFRDEENCKLEKLYKNKDVLNYLKICLKKSCSDIHTLSLPEDVMDGVLINYTIDDCDNIYIDMGSYLVTKTDPKGINSNLRLIKESDVEYINNIIDKCNNPLVKQRIFHEYVGLESGCYTETKPEGNSTIIKLPSLIEKEMEITSIQDDSKLDLLKTKVYYYDELDQKYMSRFRVLRAQFFLKMIEGNPENVLDYYKNPDNWPMIEQEIDNYYLKKKNNENDIIVKAKRFN